MPIFAVEKASGKLCPHVSADALGSDFCFCKDFYSHFICHDSKKDDPRPLHIYKKPLVWLDSIQYTDWDEVGEQMTKKEVEDFFTELHLQERIYMIDRRDFTTDSLTVIEARAYKHLLY